MVNTGRRKRGADENRMSNYQNNNPSDSSNHDHYDTEYDGNNRNPGNDFIEWHYRSREHKDPMRVTPQVYNKPALENSQENNS